jgi:HTH-type transcriptional regulator/antitoxin HigA
MLNHNMTQVIKHWGYIAPIIHLPKSEREYNSLVQNLDALLNIIGKNENHRLIGLLDIVSHFIEEYEKEHYKHEQEFATGIDALKYLMAEHNLSQSALPEIGSQGVVSEILSGKRQLNLNQIKALAKKFDVDPATFID